MYFPGLSKDRVLFHRNICLNSEPKHVESYEETCKQKPASTVTLFGRQVCPAESQSCGSSDGQLRRNSKGPVRDIDLRLPVDHIYNLDESVELRNYSSSQDMVQLERSLGLQAKTKEASVTHWLDKRNPETLIDLEEPPIWVSQKETETAGSVSSVAPVFGLGRRLEPQVSVLSSQTVLKISEADPCPADDDRCCQSTEFSDKGYGTCNSEKTTDNMTTDNMSSKQRLISCASGILDLNETPVDDPGTDLRRCFLQDLNCPYTEDTQISCEKSEVEDPTPFCSPWSQNVHENNVHEKDGTTSPASYTSCCITDNNSRTESRSSSPRTPGPACRTRLEYPLTEASPSEPKYECCDKEDSYEIDKSVQMAAESLVHISFNSLPQNQDYASKPEPTSDSSFQDQDFSSRPECSCDSYELLTLELSETSPDDYSASSKALDELSVMDNNKDFGFKLRRGRRMKNFQKEILPGLVSLSRHEIREDINILEAVLRSKEYKKMQGKMGEGSNRLGANLRSRRSGQRYVGRRRRRSE